MKSQSTCWAFFFAYLAEQLRLVQVKARYTIMGLFKYEESEQCDTSSANEGSLSLLSQFSLQQSRLKAIQGDILERYATDQLYSPGKQ